MSHYRPKVTNHRSKVMDHKSIERCDSYHFFLLPLLLPLSVASLQELTSELRALPGVSQVHLDVVMDLVGGVNVLQERGKRWHWGEIVGTLCRVIYPLHCSK